MAEWHPQLNGHEFEQILGDSEGQGRPGVLQCIGSQVGHDRVTEQQQQQYSIINTPHRLYPLILMDT